MCGHHVTKPPYLYSNLRSHKIYKRRKRKKIDHFIKYLGDKIYKYFIILFTKKDDLDAEKKK